MRKIHLPKDVERVYDFLVEYIESHRGLPPTQAEIAAGCYLSRTTVQRYLTFLHACGRIGWNQGGKRSIWLLSEDDDD